MNIEYAQAFSGYPQYMYDSVLDVNSLLDTFTTLGPMNEMVKEDSVSVSSGDDTCITAEETLEQFVNEKPLTPSQKKKIRESNRNLVCNNCHTTKTPLWRRSLDKKHNLCNACGLYNKQYGEDRPVSYLKRPQRQPRMIMKRKDGCVTLHWSQLEMLLKMARR
jgi:hypothetical protein